MLLRIVLIIIFFPSISYDIFGLSIEIFFIRKMSEKIDLTSSDTFIVSKVTALFLLNPSGLPIIRPLSSPFPEKSEMLDFSSVTSVSVTCGAKVFIPFSTILLSEKYRTKKTDYYKNGKGCK